jgi:hypothetical protein
MDIAMNEFMKRNYRCNETDIISFKKDFLRAIDGCEKIWRDDAFLKPNASKKVLQGFFDIEMVCLSLLNNQELEHAIANRERVIELLNIELEENEDFKDSVTQFTSNPKNMSLRIGRFLEILKSI